MSQDDHIGAHDGSKNIGTLEDGASENASRRRFLMGGAMAAVGALAAVGVPRTAEAVCPSGIPGVFEEDGTRVDPIPNYSPNDSLATAIVNAWASVGVSGGYYEELTDPNSTHKALAKAGISFAKGDVVVLTRRQYLDGYCREATKPVIFVLPDKPRGLFVALDQARVMMSVTPFGM